MSSLHRLQWIDNQIRNGRYPNCTGIARHFEISRRQAARDVEYLRDSLGAPAVYDPARQGYYYESAFSIPREILKADDITLLGRLAESYRAMGTNRAREIAALFSRIHRASADLAEGGADHPRHDPAPDEIRSLLETAVDEEMDLEILYRDAGNGRTRRIITPLRVIERYQNEVVQAFCRLRNDNREFRLDRILKTVLVPRTSPPPTLRSSGRQEEEEIITIGEPPEPDFGVQPFTARILTGVYSQRQTVRFYKSSELLAWLVGLSSGFEIESPDWLRIRARDTFAQLARVHETRKNE